MQTTACAAAVSRWRDSCSLVAVLLIVVTVTIGHHRVHVITIIRTAIAIIIVVIAMIAITSIVTMIVFAATIQLTVNLSEQPHGRAKGSACVDWVFDGTSQLCGHVL